MSLCVGFHPVILETLAINMFLVIWCLLILFHAASDVFFYEAILIQLNVFRLVYTFENKNIKQTNT